MAKNKLSVYLIKEGITDINDIFHEEYPVKELHKYSDKKCAYFVPSNVNPPKWLKSFFNLSSDELKQANSKVILLDRIDFENETRTFAVTFGYAKSLFKEDVLEEQFGLKVLLNSVNENELRKISKISVGGNHKQSQEQIPKVGKISEFGFDIDRDLIRIVTAKTSDDVFEKAMLTGGDIFSVTVDRNIRNIDEFLKICYARFKQTVYLSRFDWVDNIKEVRAFKEKQSLDNELLKLLNQKNFTNVWMAVPDVISWEFIKHFKYTGSKEEYDDIFIEQVMETFEGDILNVERLKSKSIYAISAEDEDRQQHRWSAYKCIIAELDVNNQSYCLNNGKWYKIDKNFAQRVNNEYQSIPISNIPFIPYESKGKQEYSEDNYNEELVKALGNAKLLHKVVEIPYGGGQGNKIEVCDVMTLDKNLIHIKKNGGSSQLSHLFNQAAVSAEALLDEGFRNKLHSKLAEKRYKELIDPSFNPNSYKIIIAIINETKNQRPKIPFFSRVAIRYTTRVISNMGYKVELKNIDMMA
ncbi:MAG: DUF6119 family protein [Syntrophomonas sp.]